VKIFWLYSVKNKVGGEWEHYKVCKYLRVRVFVGLRVCRCCMRDIQVGVYT